MLPLRDSNNLTVHSVIQLVLSLSPLHFHFNPFCDQPFMHLNDNRKPLLVIFIVF